MVSVIGIDGGVHIVYKTIDAEKVQVLFKKVMSSVGMMEMLLNGSLAREYDELLLPTEKELIAMLDGIEVVCKEGRRKVYIMLQEIE